MKSSVTGGPGPSSSVRIRKPCPSRDTTYCWREMDRIGETFVLNSLAAVPTDGSVAVKSTELIVRGSSLPDIGISPKVDEIAFKLAEGETSAPIETGDAVVVVRVKTKQAIDAAARDAARAALQTELAQQRQGAFFSAYMAKAMEKMEIVYNNETLDKIIGN